LFKAFGSIRHEAGSQTQYQSKRAPGRTQRAPIIF
jgi:hypothetical protein